MSAGVLEARTLRANDQRIHAVECGSGPLVLFVHGFPESWYSWRHQLPALAAAGYRAVAYDQRGYGRSSKPRELNAYHLRHLIDDAVGIVEALGETQAVVVGHDWGSPIAWHGAWTRPDVFRAVSSLSVPFGARNVVALPTDPFGERRPSEVDAEIAGEGRLFYQAHFNLPGHVAEDEAEQDLRRYLTGVYYSFSGGPPLPPPLDEMDLTDAPDEVIVQVLRGAMSVAEGDGLTSVMQFPETLPAWLTEADLDYFVGEFEHTGLTGPLSFYRNIDADWEWLAQFADRTLDVPSQYIGADRDIVTMWGREARERAGERRTDIREETILRGSIGHWIQQEAPDATNDALLAFLRTL